MREDGFTLIEILISFVILASFMAIVLPLFSKTATQDNNRLRHQTAARYASSLLEIAEPVDPLKSEIRTASMDGFNWQITFTPHGKKSVREEWMMTPYEVAIIISWEDQALQMSTLKLAVKEMR